MLFKLRASAIPHSPRPYPSACHSQPLRTLSHPLQQCAMGGVILKSRHTFTSETEAFPCGVALVHIKGLPHSRYRPALYRDSPFTPTVSLSNSIPFRMLFKLRASAIPHSPRPYPSACHSQLLRTLSHPPQQCAMGGVILKSRNTFTSETEPSPLQVILLLRVLCARINRPSIPPANLHCAHCCNTIARLLGNIPPPPSTSLVCAIHHTILAITISCEAKRNPSPAVSSSFT